ncbi:hypothetical protein B0H21DRAFT_825251 [Amylocystis lapponica]|nr:hypothetical protein B0H21DRAFT_825251 [Amylocystis lapponica]
MSEFESAEQEDVENVLSASSRLPPELWDHILDCLRYDPVTLKSCSLTCRAWLPAARLPLFSQVCIPTEERYLEFERFFTESPLIANCVRNLFLECGGYYTLLDREIPRILRILNKVEDVFFDRWSVAKTSEEIRQELPMMFPMVHSIYFSHTDLCQDQDIPQILCACPKLTTIRVDEVKLPWSENPPAKPLPQALSSLVPVSSIEIHTLTLYNTGGSLLEWLVKGPLVLKLRWLHVEWTEFNAGEHNSAYVQHLIYAAGEHLEDLTISLTAGYPLALNYLDLSRNTRLVRLSIRGIKLTRNYRSYCELLIGIISRRLSMRLEHIHFDMAAPYHALGSLENLNWKRFGEQLESLLKDRSGLEISIFVSSLDTPSFEKEAQVVENGIKALLPSLGAAEQERLLVVALS